MKKIVIIYKNAEPFVLNDNDNSDITSYSKELTKVMELSKICILETSEGSIILRPSEIASIFVKDFELGKGIVKQENNETKKEDVIRD